MIKISVVVIAFNEEKNIERCLKSVKPIAHEIIVIDSSSKDATALLAAGSGAKVIQRPFDNYSAQKNYGMEMTTGDYILSLDADECLSARLVDSIQKLNSSPPVIYSMNRLTNYCGAWIKHGSWYPDVKLRLWPKGAAQWRGVIHEEVVHNLPVVHLEGDILHYSYSNIAEHINQLNKFTTLSAHDLFSQNVQSGFRKQWLSPVYTFIKCYLFKGGFLDGRAGLLVAIFNSFSTFLKYAKLKQLKGTV